MSHLDLVRDRAKGFMNQMVQEGVLTKVGLSNHDTVYAPIHLRDILQNRHCSMEYRTLLSSTYPRCSYFEW